MCFRASPLKSKFIFSILNSFDIFWALSISVCEKSSEITVIVFPLVFDLESANVRNELSKPPDKAIKGLLYFSIIS